MICSIFGILVFTLGIIYLSLFCLQPAAISEGHPLGWIITLILFYIFLPFFSEWINGIIDLLNHLSK